MSDYAPITLKKKEIQQVDAQNMVYGTIEDTATNCTWPTFSTFLS